ncbi:hypothetical protein TNCV_2211501 [Trichonephila clavipes]|nr:hypothetical protein TNCV_2211501 [Trichonephila clavipes]
MNGIQSMCSCERMKTLEVMIVECTQFKTALICSRVKRKHINEKRKLKVRGNVVLFVSFDSVDVVNVFATLEQLWALFCEIKQIMRYDSNRFKNRSFSERIAIPTVGYMWPAKSLYAAPQDSQKIRSEPRFLSRA